MPGRVDKLTMLTHEFTVVSSALRDSINNTKTVENYSNNVYEFITSNDRNLLIVVRNDTVSLTLKADSTHNEQRIELGIADFNALVSLGLTQ